jgi:hypothetical protein
MMSACNGMEASAERTEPVAKALCMQVARGHLDLQEAVLGAKHCDVASTLDVLQQAMTYLMAQDRTALCAAFPDEWPTFARVSKAQHAYEKRFQRMAAMYTRKVVEWHNEAER